jgi:hypothetical protein
VARVVEGRRVGVVTRLPRPVSPRPSSTASSNGTSRRLAAPARPEGGRPAEEDVRAAMVRIYVNGTPVDGLHTPGPAPKAVVSGR